MEVLDYKKLKDEYKKMQRDERMNRYGSTKIEKEVKDDKLHNLDKKDAFYKYLMES